MKKLSIKRVVEFRSKSDRTKKSFVVALKEDKAKIDPESKGGGDYWVSCLSAISNSFKLHDLKYIIEKRSELEEKRKETEHKITQTMYKRNVDILNTYKDFDLKKWKPSKKINLVKKNKDDSILTIKGLQVQVTPHHVFTFQKDDVTEIGAIWFIAKLDGFKKDELGMFADILYRYLKTHFSKEYNVNSKYCIAVDVFKNFEINYSQLENGKILSILDPTLDEIKKLM